MSEKKPYQKRFERDKNAPRINLTARDIEVIKLVYEHRFLNADQIRVLLDGSAQKLTRRLNGLFHHAYLDRPRAQLKFAGNQPMVYALGNKGAELLERELDQPMPAVDWNDKNRSAGGLFLEHTLQVSQFATVLRLACRKYPDVQVIGPAQIVSRRRDRAEGLGWKVEVKKATTGLKRDINFNIIPDYLFGLRFTRNGKRLLAFFFVEVDQATMPIKRNNFYRSSFYKKMVCYWDSWQQGLFEKSFGFKHARIVTITSSSQRIDSLIKANQELDPRGQGLRMFLFAPHKLLNLEKPEWILGPLWKNGRGEKDSLIGS